MSNRRRSRRVEVEVACKAALADAGMAQIRAADAMGSCDTIVSGIMSHLTRRGLEPRRLLAEGRIRSLPTWHPWYGREADATHHAVLVRGNVVVDPAARQFGHREPIVSTVADFRRRWRKVVKT